MPCVYRSRSETHKTSRNVTNRLVDAILLPSVVHGSDSQWTPATHINRFSRSRVQDGDGKPHGPNLLIYDSTNSFMFNTCEEVYAFKYMRVFFLATF